MGGSNGGALQKSGESPGIAAPDGRCGTDGRGAAFALPDGLLAAAAGALVPGFLKKEEMLPLPLPFAVGGTALAVPLPPAAFFCRVGDVADIVTSRDSTLTCALLRPDATLRQPCASAGEG